MGWLRQESAYDRRMRELEEEAERIRKNMQQLMKNSHRPGTTPVASSSLYPAPTEQGQLRSPKTTGPSTKNDVDMDIIEMDEDTEEQELVTQESARPQQSSGFRRSTAPAAPPKEKLASYLASGSFGKRGSLSRERRIQRNKAIFMFIVALLALFSLYIGLK